MAKISFVYFDVGGVAIKDFSDSDKWDVMMRDMGVDPRDQKEIDRLYDEIEDDVCMGKRNIDELVPIYREKFKLPIPPDFSMLQYFIDHFDSNKSLWPVTEKLKSKIKVGLLTDQYNGMLDGIFARQLLAPVEWDVIVDSCQVGVRKPMPEIYAIAEKRAGVPVGEILFIDNREKNLIVPHDRGWQTFLYDSKDYDKSTHKLEEFLRQTV